MPDISRYGDYVNDGMIAIDLTATYASTSAGSTSIMPHKPGDRRRSTNTGEYIFARAASDVTYGMVCIAGVYGDSSLSSDATRAPILQFAPITTTNAIVGGANGLNMVVVAQVSIASSYYGWVAANGSALRANVLVGCNPKVPLYTTSTAGSLDDTTVSSGYVSGITLNTSATSASATWCIANWPKVIHAQTSSS